MIEFLEDFFPNAMKIWPEFITATKDTLLMLGFSGILSFIFGIIIAIALVVTKKDGLAPNRFIQTVLNAILNLLRSIPFVILIVSLVAFTRFIVGIAFGVLGTIPPLVIGATPYFARQIEASLNDVDGGVIEASQSMGFTNLQIIIHVYLKESIPSMMQGLAISLISLLGLIAIAGMVGAGGLGDMAIRYGYARSQADVSYVCIALILLIVAVIQGVLNYITKKTTHK